MTNRITRRWKRITIIGSVIAIAAVFGMAMSTSAASSSQSQGGEGLAQVESSAPYTSPTPDLADCEVELALEYGFDTGSIYKLTITAGEDTVLGWHINWIWPDDTVITHHFDVGGIFEQVDRRVTVTAHFRYQYIAPGESTSFAFLVDTPWLTSAPEIGYYCTRWNG